ncbi:MAG TPA: ferritin-like domain-containing protein [Acidimicrobiales bacterium]
MTTTDAESMRSNLELLGRDEINDYEAIYSVIGREEPSGRHAVPDHCDAEFTWDYTKGARPQLDKLYEKAKGAQWNGRTDLPWETEVDQERLAYDLYIEGTRGPLANADMTGTPLAKWGEKEWVRLNIENQNWTLSQFMHGEQGALLCTAKIVETVPWIDAKYYAATQVVDEARHVEVFSRYIQEKCSGKYQVNAHLSMLLDDIIADSRWDMTYLGMQVMVEGLALAAFSFMHQLTPEPLLKKLLRYVMADEARHVAFGVLSLKEVYDGLSAAEIRERQEFAFEAAVRMRDRMAGQEIWDRMGITPAEMLKIAEQDPQRNDFQSVLFSKIVPNCKKLGLLDAADGWLRQKFTEMGVIAFEDFEDTTLEVDQAADGSPVDRVDL